MCRNDGTVTLKELILIDFRDGSELWFSQDGN